MSDPAKAALCVKLSRILLIAPIFFFAGGVFGSVLLVRKQFNIQAVTPLIYNCGTILGGVHALPLSRRFIARRWHGSRRLLRTLPFECHGRPPRRDAL